MKNEKQNIKRELEELNSILKDMPDDGGLNFPIGYFEELENDILNKTIYAEKDINNNKKIIPHPINFHFFGGMMFPA